MDNLIPGNLVKYLESLRTNGIVQSISLFCGKGGGAGKRDFKKLEGNFLNLSSKARKPCTSSKPFSYSS